MKSPQPKTANNSTFLLKFLSNRENAPELNISPKIHTLFLNINRTDQKMDIQHNFHLLISLVRSFPYGLPVDFNLEESASIKRNKIFIPVVRATGSRRSEHSTNGITVFMGVKIFQFAARPWIYVLILSAKYSPDMNRRGG